MRKRQAPTVEPGDGNLAETIERHPAYAQISASRVSGQVHLYGSDFAHQHYMTITVRRSDLTRNLSNDWPHAHPMPLVSVAMSEAQWATFVSSANIGFGVQCTLESLDGKTVPGIEQPVQRVQQFKDEIKHRFAEADAEIAALRALLLDAKLSGKARDELVKALERVRSAYRSGVPFVAEQFDEHVEQVQEQARVEIAAYTQNVLVQRGLKALQADVEAAHNPLPVLDVPPTKE